MEAGGYSTRAGERQTEGARAVGEELVQPKAGRLQLPLHRLAGELSAYLRADLLPIGERDLEVGARRSGGAAVSSDSSPPRGDV
jgi:hypothetical protein